MKRRKWGGNGAGDGMGRELVAVSLELRPYYPLLHLATVFVYRFYKMYFYTSFVAIHLYHPGFGQLIASHCVIRTPDSDAGQPLYHSPSGDKTNMKQPSFFFSPIPVIHPNHSA